MKKTKKNENKKSLIKKVIIALAVLLFVSASVYTAFSIGFSKQKAEASMGNLREENMLIAVENADIEKGFALSGGNVVMTSNSFISFRSDGSVRSADKLGYSKPVVKTADNEYIVFERSTGKYAVLNRSGVAFHNDGGSEIINACIAKNGNYAVITRKTQVASVLSVYSASEKLLFQWECTDEYLTQVALSPNGKTVAVAAVGVKNGEGYSKIMYFHTDSTDVEGEIEYAGESVYVINFISNDKLSVITDLSYMIADLDELTSKVISYDYDVLNGYYLGPNSMVAVLKKEFGTLDKNILTVIDKKAEKVFEKEFSSDIIDFKIDKKRVYVMTTGKVSVYLLSSGEKTDVITTDGGLNSMIINDGCIYCLSDTAVYKYEM